MMQAQRRRFGFGLGLVLARHVPLQKRAACLGPTGCCRLISAMPALRGFTDKSVGTAV